MATPPSLMSLLALMCMALLVIPANAFVQTFPSTSHALRLRSASCKTPDIRVCVLPVLKMSGGRNDTPANPLNQNNDEHEYASSRGTETR